MSGQISALSEWFRGGGIMVRSPNDTELRTSFAVEAVDAFDPFLDEEPLECSIDHYEVCESCQ